MSSGDAQLVARYPPSAGFVPTLQWCSTRRAATLDFGHGRFGRTDRMTVDTAKYLLH
jgi:hypothetical protein